MLARHWSELLLGLAFALAALPVTAQDAPAHGPALNWVRAHGAQSCIAPVALAQRIEERLGRAVFVRPSAAILVIEGRVEVQAAGGFAAVIRMCDADGTVYGTRELAVPDADCAGLSELAAFVIAVTIRHDANGGGIPLPGEIAAQLDSLFADEVALPAAEQFAPAQAPEPRAPRTLPVVQRTAPSVPWYVSVEAGLGLVTGLQPSAAWVPLVRARVGRLGLGSVALSASLGLAQEQRFGAEPGALSYQPMLFGLSGCASLWHTVSVELSGCIDARVGRFKVTPLDFASGDRSTYELWSELVAGLDARLLLFSHGALHVQPGLPVRLARPTFEYQDRRGQSQPAHAVTRFGFELSLSFALEF